MTAPAPQDMDRLAIALARLLASYWRRRTEQSDALSIQEGVGVGSIDNQQDAHGGSTSWL
jgi:hypothetical protein